MQLKPCVQCRRHVEREAALCPFCDAPQLKTLPAKMMVHVGRVSRAAIFASAAACAYKAPPPHAPPPPPPPDPMVVQQFATAPPPTPGKASVRGFVTLDGRPLTGVAIRATRDNSQELQTTTGSHGEYSFVDVEPGQWVLDVNYEMPRYRPQDSPAPRPLEQIQLAAGSNTRHDIGLSTPPPPEPDRGPCCKPYGAPPARRRVV